MKIKIKSPTHTKLKMAFIIGILLASVLIGALLFFSFAVGGFFPFVKATFSLLAEMQKDEPILAVCLPLLAILLLLFTGISTINFLVYKKKVRTPPFTHLHFVPSGVFLEKAQAPHQNVFLPYAETDLNFTFSIGIVYQGKGGPTAVITGATLTFTPAEGDPLILHHFGELPFFKKIAPAAANFKLFSYQVLPDDEHNALQRDLVKYVSEQMENIVNYGVYKPLPKKRFVCTALVTIILWASAAAMFLPLWLQSREEFHLGIFIALGILPGFLFFSGLFFFCKLAQDIKAQRKIDKIKSAGVKK